MSTIALRRSQRSRKPVESYYDEAKRNSIDEVKVSTTQSPSRYATRSSVSPSRKRVPVKLVRKPSTKTESEVKDLEYITNEEEESDYDDNESTSRMKFKSRTSPTSDSAVKKNARKHLLSEASPLVKNHQTPNKLGSIKKNSSPVEKSQAKSPLIAISKKMLTDDAETPDLSLFASLLHAKRYSKSTSGIEIRDIARIAFDTIVKDANRAYIDVLNLILRSVGGRFEHLIKSNINLDSLPDEDLAATIQIIVEDMKETPADAILLCADPEGALGTRTTGNQRSKAAMKEYRRIFQQFWYELGALFIEALSNERIEGRELNLLELANGLVIRLMDLVWIGVPDIRAAVAIAIYQVSVAFLEGTVLFQSKLKMANRQLQSAKRISSSSGSRKVKALEHQVIQLEESLSSLENLVKEDVISVFSKRYRDKNEHIRAESLMALSSFSLIRPDVFLNSSYLKYFGWMLSDKNSNVRRAAVMGFLAPFRKNKRIEEEATTINKSSSIEIAGMASAIKKFLERLVDLIIDVDIGVQELASELLLYLVQKDYFDDVDNDDLWYQINSRAIALDTSPTVRRNALYFIMEQLQPFDSSSVDPDAESVERIRALVQWTSHVLSDSDIPIEHMRFELTDLVITSLRSMPEHKQLACNWAAILLALKGDEPSKSTRMTRKSIGKGDPRSDAVQQRVILRWLVTSAESEVRSLSTFDGPMMYDIDPALTEIHRKLNDTNKTLKGKAVNRTSTSHESLTCALLRALPDLLASFKSETLVMQSLTSLPRYMLPNVFNLTSRKEDFHSLVSILSKVFLEVSDEVVLCNCALSLISLTRGDHALTSDALLILKKTTNLLANRLVELCERSTADDQGNFAALDSHRSLHLCVRRLRIISKLSYLPDLLCDSANHAEENEHLEHIFTAVFDRFSKELSDRKLVTQDSTEDLEVPEIWTSLDDKVHSILATSVSDSLDLLLSLIAWKVHRFLECIKSQKEDDADDCNMKQSEFILRLRNHITDLILLCFEQCIDEPYADKVSDGQKEFATLLGQYASRLTGDLRMLFPKSWNAANLKPLSDLALGDESYLLGGVIRFLRTQESKLRECGDELESTEMARNVLLPLARGNAGNWKDGNRKEAGHLLSFIHGAGKEAHNIAQSFSRVCKKIDSIRVLEAHMNFLRQRFYELKKEQPMEPDTDNPTAEEIEAFTKAESIYLSKFEVFENIMARLSASLGVGSITDKKLVHVLGSFVCEGIRYAFSTEADDLEGHVFLGDRLTFLLPLSKYLNWIRQNKTLKERVKNEINKKENELRRCAGYEEVYEEDKAAIVAFRQLGGLGEFQGEDEEETTASAQSTTRGLDDEETTGSAKSSTVHTTAASSMGETDGKGSSQHKSIQTSKSSNIGVGGASSVSSTSLRSKFSSSQSLSPLEEADEEVESDDDDDENAPSANGNEPGELTDVGSRNPDYEDDDIEQYDEKGNQAKLSDKNPEHGDQAEDAERDDHDQSKDEDEISQLSTSPPPQKKHRKL